MVSLRKEVMMMPAYKDQNKGTWYVSFYYEDWNGQRKKKLKRGFVTKRDALAWEREFLLQKTADLTMGFEKFVELYITDKEKRIRENTWSTKEHIIQKKILPYFAKKRICDITPRSCPGARTSRCSGARRPGAYWWWAAAAAARASPGRRSN